MPSPTRAPFIILSLIGTILCLSVGAIALIVLLSANKPDSAAIAAACKNEVGAAIKTESDRVAKACEEKPAVIVTKTVPSNNQHPGFVYPENIQVSGGLSYLNGTSEYQHHIYFYRNAPISECGECDGGPVPAITIIGVPVSSYLNTQKTIAEVVTSMYPATSTTFRNTVSKEEIINGQNATVVTTEYDDEMFGEKNIKLEHIILQKGSRIIEIKYYQYSNTAYNGYISPEVWRQVRASLDFSKIE